jgi:hypothetical protein
MMQVEVLQPKTADQHAIQATHSTKQTKSNGEI